MSSRSARHSAFPCQTGLHLTPVRTTMSEYFRVLKRLEADRAQRPDEQLQPLRVTPRLVVAEGGARPAPKVATPSPAEPPAAVWPSAMPSLKTIEAYSALF